MDKILTLHRDKAYRAKIESIKVEENDFFYDTYQSAEKIVNDIIDDMRVFKNTECDSGFKYKARFAGLGNNIVFFSGGRGYGKTSVMRSFAKYLMENEKEEYKEKKNGNKFIVLDSIDPSAMESGENILRVVMSRMYYMFEKKDQEFIRDATGDRDIYRKNKFELLESFQKCYDSIDSIKSDKKSEYDTDDLEKLAKLGSSAGLKECIHETVKKYLKFMGEIETNKDEKSYLVVAIDDMDLATKKIYRICEDIRNYLSVPNIIVLFAADYNQLVYAIYQKYLCRYQTLRLRQNEFDVERECYIMTGKYLEKFCPVGHRVELPKMEDMIANKKEKIRLVYCRYNAKKEKFEPEEFVEGTEVSCNEIQEQLLRCLYLKTGIIFLREAGVLHFILPRTLRELTHFTRMLDDMEKIAEKEINLLELFEDEKKRNNMIKNISIFKEYFMNYWCINNLNIRQKKLIEMIDSANEDRNSYQVCEYIKSYLKQRGKKKVEIKEDISYWEIKDIIKQKFSKEKELQEALCAYYTIFLNEWFASALVNREEFVKISLFLKKPGDQSMGNKSRVLNLIVDVLTKELGNIKVKVCNNESLICIRNISANYEVQDYFGIGAGEDKEEQTQILDKVYECIKALKETSEKFKYEKEDIVSKYAYINSFPFINK